MNLQNLIATRLPAGKLALLSIVQQVSAEGNLPLYLVGGFVRDLLLSQLRGEVVSALDFDIIVEGDSAQLVRDLASKVGGQWRVHPRFGTAQWELPAHLQVSSTLTHLDFAMARTERYPQPASLPIVEPANILQDFVRRDFTINAMAIVLYHAVAHYGDLLDPLQGWQDLQAGILRILHPQSFQDDPTRLFRAVRFATRLGFSFSAETEQAWSPALPVVAHLTADRLRHELDLLCGEKTAQAAFALLAKRQLSVAIHPALAHILPAGITAPQQFGLAGWLWQVPSVAQPAVAERLNLSLAVREICLGVRMLLEKQGEWQVFSHPSEWVQAWGSFPLASLELALQIAELAPLHHTLQSYLSEWRTIANPINGDDLCQLGMKPGRQFKTVLWQAHAAVLDGVVPANRQAVLDWVQARHG
jgi:tRNA nucleotidyltransferase (CCA-adding enzyme)